MWFRRRPSPTAHLADLLHAETQSRAHQRMQAAHDALLLTAEQAVTTGGMAEVPFTICGARVLVVPPGIEVAVVARVTPEPR